jgi:EAL domain-containing protein (putative c-di-GMP-specific phosphodiesterase class I)
MKLDRSLVRALPEDREDAAIVRALVDAGHALGLTIVAEGVETEAQCAFLAGIGCDDGQGGLFGQPLAAASFRARLTG